jgi:UDP-N-acetylmuramyl tripeptide synthase
VILEKDLEKLISDIESAVIEDRPELIEKALDQIESNDSN